MVYNTGSSTAVHARSSPKMHNAGSNPMVHNAGSSPIAHKEQPRGTQCREHLPGAQCREQPHGTQKQLPASGAALIFLSRDLGCLPPHAHVWRLCVGTVSAH